MIGAADPPTVFITGAAAGIGRATALTFARHGYRVGAYDIDPAGLASLREEIAGDGGRVTIGQLDVTEADDWADQLAAFTGNSRRLDILVNNAGVLSGGRFEQIGLETQRRMVDINVYGMLAGLHTAFPYLRATPGAQVVNLCSASAIYGQPELATYSATKFAVRGLTEALELEWRRYGIRVLAMWPLFVKTAMVDGLETGSTKSLGVHLTADDVAQAIYEATRPGRIRWPRVHFPVGRQTKVVAGLAQVMPNFAQRLLNKTVTRH
ncbi:MAG: SDR family oxidoreductase [Mycobacterium sp.]|nr:SDR family oxidoreductase [Mycobacterium sp.]